MRPGMVILSRALRLLYVAAFLGCSSRETNDVVLSPPAAAIGVAYRSRMDERAAVSPESPTRRIDTGVIRLVQASRSPTKLAVKVAFDSESADGVEIVLIEEPRGTLIATAMGSYTLDTGPYGQLDGVIGAIYISSKHLDDSGPITLECHLSAWVAGCRCDIDRTVRSGRL